MRKRYAVLLTLAGAAALTIAAQAMRSEPVQPYVRIEHFRPMPPVARYGCESGERVILYTTGKHEELEPVPTGEPC